MNTKITAVMLIAIAFAQSRFFLFTTYIEKASNIDLPIVAFFSDIKITNDFDGTVYALFSTVEVEGGEAHIFSFSSEISGATSVTPLVKVFSRLFLKTDGNVYSDKIPTWFFLLLVSVFEFLSSLALYQIKKPFFDQGGVILYRETERTLRFGILTYVPIACIIIIFVLSVALLPIALIIFAVVFVLNLIGEVSFFLSVGQSVFKYMKHEVPPELKLTVGAIITKTACFIPFVQVPLIFLFLPALQLGIFSVTLINWQFLKNFYETPEFNLTKKILLDKSVVRDMIKAND